MRVRVRAAAAAGLLGVMVLAGCGAGQDAATSRDLPSVPGVNADDAGIGVRNAAVVFQIAGYERGGTAPVAMSIVNDTGAPARLTGATSEAGQVDFDRVEIPAYGMVETTLEVTDLVTELNATGSVPLELTFTGGGDGATLSIAVPVAPPAERAGHRSPLTFDDDDEH